MLDLGPGDVGCSVTPQQWRSMTISKEMEDRKYDAFMKVNKLMKSDYFTTNIARGLAFAYTQEDEHAQDVFERLGIDMLDAYSMLDDEDGFNSHVMWLDDCRTYD